MLEVLLGAAGLVAGAPVDLAVRGHHQDGREAAHAVLCLQLLVALGVRDLRLDLLGAREVEGHKDVVLLGALHPGVVLEDLVVELDAPAAPVRAGEVDEEVLALLLGGRGGGVKVVEPGLVRVHGSGEDGEAAQGEGGEGVEHVRVWFEEGRPLGHRTPRCTIRLVLEDGAPTQFSPVPRRQNARFERYPALQGAARSHHRGVRRGDRTRAGRGPPAGTWVRRGSRSSGATGLAATRPARARG